ncbi:hypothetical protein LTR36_004851 [Oleoguttula mirabilis]|uniref:Uncharacterized protein n=1 Tax=Oleoguttula mirabilis TaxID=1507867 RepID=A0AAV9JFM1_9PEZI|nr:hypothetical protein LTR36_004851 [Oleoguttula mirabilis]
MGFIRTVTQQLSFAACHWPAPTATSLRQQLHEMQNRHPDAMGTRSSRRALTINPQLLTIVHPQQPPPPTATHPTLLRLGPEERKMIYDYLLPDGEALPATGKLPVVTRICRWMRQETLPIYRSRNLFSIRYSTSERIVAALGPTRESPSFEHRALILKKSGLAHIKHLRITSDRSSPSSGRCRCGGNCGHHITLDIADHAYTITLRLDMQCGRSPRSHAAAMEIAKARAWAAAFGHFAGGGLGKNKVLHESQPPQIEEKGVMRQATEEEMGATKVPASIDGLPDSRQYKATQDSAMNREMLESKGLRKLAWKVQNEALPAHVKETWAAHQAVARAEWKKNDRAKTELAAQLHAQAAKASQAKKQRR